MVSAKSLFSGAEAVPITRGPRSRVTCTSAVATPLAAPRIRIDRAGRLPLLDSMASASRKLPRLTASSKRIASGSTKGADLGTQMASA
ncbi:hypothetical protein D3C71_2111170 [compost metagenome]